VNVAGALSDTITNLAPGASVTYTFTVTIDPSATGNLVNTATVAAGANTIDTNPANNSAIDTDALGLPADLAVTKDDGKTTAIIGTSDTYTIIVTNHGPTTLSSLVLTDTVPAALQNATFGTPSAGTYDPVTGAWTSLSIAAGQSVSITLTGTIDPSASGSMTNVATVAPPAGVADTNSANNSATDTDTLRPPEADLAITKTDGKDSVNAGAQDSYTMTISNYGPDTVTSLSLVDTLPAALLNPVFGTPSAGSYDPSTHIWSSLSLATGQSVTITLSGTIDPGATGTITNSATVSPPAGVVDTNSANDTASDTDTINPT
jgi:uncharacterized repeat protein (TIGR01451 family)